MLAIRTKTSSLVVSNIASYLSSLLLIDNVLYIAKCIRVVEYHLKWILIKHIHNNINGVSPLFLIIQNDVILIITKMIHWCLPLSGDSNQIGVVSCITLRKPTQDIFEESANCKPSTSEAIVSGTNRYSKCTDAYMFKAQH